MKYDFGGYIVTFKRAVTLEKKHNYFKEIKRLKADLEDLSLNEDQIDEFKREIKYQRDLSKTRSPIYYNVWVYYKKHRVDLPKRKIQVTDDLKIGSAIKQSAQEAIRDHRYCLRQKESYYEFAGSVAQKVGSTFEIPGQMIRICEERCLRKLYDPKAPVEAHKYIGLELEFCAPVEEKEFALKLYRAGLAKFTQLKKDGSLRPKDKETGYELAILLKESNYKSDLKKVLSILSQVGAISEDRRCGLHVHIDMRKRNKEIVYNNLVVCQEALLSLVDPKRHNNEFCRLVKSKKFPISFTGDRQERYKTINAAAYYRYKTLEVRMHEGTLDYSTICSWMDLLIKVANGKKKLKENVNRLTILKKRFNLNERLYRMLLDRSCFWQVTHPNSRHGEDAEMPSPQPLRRVSVEELREAYPDRPQGTAAPSVNGSNLVGESGVAYGVGGGSAGNNTSYALTSNGSGFTMPNNTLVYFDEIAPMPSQVTLTRR